MFEVGLSQFCYLILDAGLYKQFQCNIYFWPKKLFLQEGPGIQLKVTPIFSVWGSHFARFSFLMCCKVNIMLIVILHCSKDQTKEIWNTLKSALNKTLQICLIRHFKNIFNMRAVIMGHEHNVGNMKFLTY